MLKSFSCNNGISCLSTSGFDKKYKINTENKMITKISVVP